MQRLTLAMPGNEDFARRFAQACGSAVGRIETRHAPDGESYVRLHAVLAKVRQGDRHVEIAVPDLSTWRDRTPVGAAPQPAAAAGPRP